MVNYVSVVLLYEACIQECIQPPGGSIPVVLQQGLCVCFVCLLFGFCLSTHQLCRFRKPQNDFIQEECGVVKQ